jgi:RNA polymerase sigma-70 factor (ECF subfamily)
LAVTTRFLGLGAEKASAAGGALGLAKLFVRQPTFEEQVRAEIPTLYRVARRLVPNQIEEAEDAVGQTLLKAFRNENQFNGNHLRSWLITILRNELHNHRRYKSVRPLEVELEQDYSDDGLWASVSHRLDREAILRELDNLDEDFRMAIQLCDVEGMSYDEAALAMGVPIGTIRSRLFRARAKLRDRLAEEILALEVR